MSTHKTAAIGATTSLEWLNDHIADLIDADRYADTNVIEMLQEVARELNSARFTLTWQAAFLENANRALEQVRETNRKLRAEIAELSKTEEA